MRKTIEAFALAATTALGVASLANAQEVDLGIDLGELEALEQSVEPVETNSMTDGQITKDEVATSEPVILTRSQVIELGNMDQSELEVLGISNISVNPTDETQAEFEVTIDGGNTWEVGTLDGMTVVGNASSASDAFFRGLDLGVLFEGTLEEKLFTSEETIDMEPTLGE